jgi:hypothetical protein
MKKRFLELGLVAATIVVVAMLMKLAPVSVAGQAPTDTGKAGPAPKIKTAWGAPDLQGIWGDDYYIPLQRPTRYANKEFFTDEERAAPSVSCIHLVSRI